MVVALGVSGLAQGPIGPGGPPNGQRPDLIAEVQRALGLTAAQVSSLQSLVSARQTQLQTLFTELQQRQSALRDSTSTNPAEIGNLFLAVRSVSDRIAAVNTRFKTDFTNLLTSSQQQMVKDIEAAAQKAPPLARLGVIGDGPGDGPGGPGGPGFGRPGGPGRGGFGLGMRGNRPR